VEEHPAHRPRIDVRREPRDALRDRHVLAEVGEAAAEEIVAVVAEVNNTFGERCIYLLDDLEKADGAWSTRTPVTKTLYVSPFYDVSGTYAFRFGALGDRLDIRITLEREGALNPGIALQELADLARRHHHGHARAEDSHAFA